MIFFMRVVTIFSYRFKTLFKNKTNLFMLLLLPAVIFSCMWLFGEFYAEGGRRIPVGVTDNDNSEFSKLAVERLVNDSSSIQVVLCDYDEAEKLVMNGSLEAAIIIKKGFMDSLIDIDGDNIVEILHSPSSMLKSFVKELFIQQVSRLRFSSEASKNVVELAIAGEYVNPYGADPDSVEQNGADTDSVDQNGADPNSVDQNGADTDSVDQNDADTDSVVQNVSDKDDEDANASKEDPNASKKTLSKTELNNIWDEAFAYSDAYWEPVPLMTIDYRAIDSDYSASGSNNHATDSDYSATDSDYNATGSNYSATGSNYHAIDSEGARPEPGALDFVNMIITNVIVIIIIFYSMFCLLITPGIALKERDDGMLARIKSAPHGYICWSASTFIIPAFTYAIPLSVLISLSPNSFFSQYLPSFLRSIETNAIIYFFSTFFLFLLPVCAVISGVGFALALSSKTHQSFRFKLFTTIVCSLAIFILLL